MVFFPKRQMVFFPKKRGVQGMAEPSGNAKRKTVLGIFLLSPVLGTSSKSETHIHGEMTPDNRPQTAKGKKLEIRFTSNQQGH